MKKRKKKRAKKRIARSWEPVKNSEGLTFRAWFAKKYPGRKF